MPPTLRIGTQIWPDDPFWVQVQEAIRQRAQQLTVDLISIDIEDLHLRPAEHQASVVEELLALDLNALIGWSLDDALVFRVLDADLPVVHLGESDVRHPRFVSPLGLYDIAKSLGAFLVEQLAGNGVVLAVGGLQGHGEDRRSRLAGIRAALRPHPGLRMVHIPSLWRYEQAYPQIYEALPQIRGSIDAIFGFSDSLALAARDAGRALGMIDERTLVVGINGDPLALAAITEGCMTATMQTPAAEFGAQALDLAIRAAQGLSLPAHFSYQPRLVTAHNVAEVAAQQLVAIADLPSRLVGFNRQQEQQRLTQLETSLEINHRAGLILDRQHLSHAIADLIRANYGYDEAQLFLWDARERVLVLEQPAQPADRRASFHLDEAPVLRAAMERNEPIFIPDVRHSHRFAPDPNYPETRSRVVVPIRLGGQIMGLLGLHSYHSTRHTDHELIGLQTLADQLGIAMRNAELYSEAVKARALAEKADQLKTRLLANVSHELRAPLNIILGYSKVALETPDPYGLELPPSLRSDLQHIYRSGEHLIRLINDLLDLSRAEIDELDLFPETIAPRAFLEEVFHSIANQVSGHEQVAWRLDVPARLPVIQADPVRLRQILLNLLHNARKFTSSGQIALGAEVVVPHLHIWVADTGRGIPIELQERIFEPFMTAQDDGRREGIGLGLSIARRLVALHRGSMTLESKLGQGSTFHIYLPLPSLSGRPVTFTATNRPALLLIAADDQPDDTIAELCRHQGLALRRVGAGADLPALLANVQPVALAWNLAQIDADDWAAFQQIRGQPQLCQLPIILYHHEPSDIAAPSIGMTGVVLKPLSDTKLLDAIARLRAKDTAGPILIVDDDRQAHALYRRLIAEHLPGYPLRSATGGHEALALLEQETPSLVILDLVMPEVDGFAVLEQLGASPQTWHVPVLVMSGHMLSFEDIQRLDQAHVIFHGKDVLTEVETVDIVWRALAQTDALPQHTSMLVKHAVAYIHQNYACGISRQEIADALGIGGIMRGLRTIPVFLDICRDMEELCPDALVLNYVNPMAILCWALSRATSITTVGLCHSVPHTAHQLAEDIGVPFGEIKYLVAGINHVAFFLTFERNGEDLYPRLWEYLQSGKTPVRNVGHPWILTDKVRYEVFKRLGYFVTESSEHFSEYVPWFIKRHRPDLIEKYDIPLDEYIRRCENHIEGWGAMRTELEREDLPLEVKRSVEYASLIIHSIETGTSRTIYGNVPNRGLIDNLPDDCCVEVPCLVDANGVQPTKVGGLPPHLAALMQTNINVQRLTVEAVLTGRREHIYHAAMLDPHTAAELDLDQIWSLVDDLIEAHGDWLPVYQ